MAGVQKEGCTLDEDDIDRLKLPKVLQLCKENEIDLTRKPKLDEIKLELKLKLLCKDSSRQEAISKLQHDYKIDETRRGDMTELYKKISDTTLHILKMDDPIVKDLRQTFPEIQTHLSNEICNLEKSNAPILVLGETGAGKSSFINLLLGEDILPSSMLSNTHVLCEIKYSENSAATMYPLNDKGHPKVIKCGKTFRDDLAVEIQRLDNGHSIYKRAEIYLPCPILKSGVVIVDSPGIGETKEMENIVLDYILNACTFIYIIASDSAGGMQHRMQKLLNKVYLKALNEQKVYQPERAIFVCNKWDQVPPNERKEVREDTVKKIMDCWPSCKESQILTFSTKEAAIMQGRGKLSPKFQGVIEEINKLVPLGREIQILKSYKYLDNFVTRCLHCFGTYLEQTEMSAWERQKKQKDTMDRLQILKGKVESYFEEQNRVLKHDIGVLTDKLIDFLREEENMKSVCRFSKRDFAHEERWNGIAIAIRSKIYDRIMILIKGWEEKRGEFKKIGDRISKSLEEEFPKFTAEIFKAQKNLTNVPFENQPPEDDSLVPDLVRKQFEGLTFGMKIAVGIGLAPVLFLGMAVRLPLFGLKSLKKSITDLILKSDFRKAADDSEEEVLFEKYARGTVEKITDQLELRSVIEAEIQPLFKYLLQEKTKIESLINSDMELLVQMREEARNERDIRKTYSPLKEKFMMLQLELENFLFINMPHRYCRDFKEYSTACVEDWKGTVPVCCGLEAKIFRSRLKDGLGLGTFQDVCVRIPSEEIKPTNVSKQKKIQEAYRNIDKSFMVKYLGTLLVRRQHYQVIESLQGSLRDMLPQFYMEYDTNELRRTFLQGVTQQIVQGLSYLHERSFVHFDLSQDTVAVDPHGSVKLTNICVPKRINVEPVHCENGKVDLSKCIYIPEKFIFCKDRRGSQCSILSNSENLRPDSPRTNLRLDKYDPKDDMYGVGMLMWEIWVGEPLYKGTHWHEVKENVVNSTEKFRKFLRNFQPKKEPHFVMKTGSEDQIMSEWWTSIHGCINRKLTSKDWLSRWEDLRSTYPDVSLIYSYSHFCNSPSYDDD